MSFSSWPKAAALALLPVAALAQQGRQAGPADANAPVPAAGYVSAFTHYRIATDNQASPDTVWRAANEELGRGNPEPGHMAMPGMQTPPARQQSPAAQPDTHAGHSGPMSMPGMNPGAASSQGSTYKRDRHDGHAGHQNMQGK